jgi:hypothetical protein
MVCGETRRFSHHNRLIFLQSAWQSDSARFDYALCQDVNWYTRRDDLTGRSTRDEIDREFLPWWNLTVARGEASAIRKTLRWGIGECPVDSLEHHRQAGAAKRAGA